ncbi:hypothetical protein ACSBR2_038600 [Camellia fascicularis]
MDSLYIPCVEHAKEWLSNSNHPIDSGPNMPVHGSMVPVQVEGSDEQYQRIDDVCMGAIYIISLFMENMYT